MSNQVNEEWLSRHRVIGKYVVDLVFDELGKIACEWHSPRGSVAIHPDTMNLLLEYEINEDVGYCLKAIAEGGRKDRSYFEDAFPMTDDDTLELETPYARVTFVVSKSIGRRSLRDLNN